MAEKRARKMRFLSKVKNIEYLYLDLISSHVLLLIILQSKCFLLLYRNRAKEQYNRYSIISFWNTKIHILSYVFQMMNNTTTGFLVNCFGRE